MTNVAVVTVSFNTEPDTHIFFESLSKVHTSAISLSFFVVDNGSKIPYALNEKEKKQGVQLIRSEENTGFAGGFNIGMRQALASSVDYVLIVNNDTIVHPDMITHLLKVLKEHPKAGIAVPKIYFAKGHEFHKDRYSKDELGKVFWYAGGSTDWANVRSVHRGIDEVDKGQYDTIEKVQFATGCCMMFPRKVLEKVGLFDERYFLYFEDADMNERVLRAEYEVYYVPTAELIHVNAASTGGAGNVLHDYFITRNRMLFGMNYAPIRTKFALFRESLRILRTGRPYQKLGIRDYYFGRLGKGTYFEHKARETA